MCSGAEQVLQAVLAQVAQRRRRPAARRDQLRGRAREQDLAAVAGREQARDAVERRAEVVAVALLGLAGVQRHAHPERPGRAPGFGRERALGGQRPRPSASGAVAKAAQKASPTVLKTWPPCGLDRLRAAARRGGRAAAAIACRQALPEPGAALDVGEEEGDGASWLHYWLSFHIQVMTNTETIIFCVSSLPAPGPDDKGRGGLPSKRGREEPARL